MTILSEIINSQQDTQLIINTVLIFTALTGYLIKKKAGMIGAGGDNAGESGQCVAKVIVCGGGKREESVGKCREEVEHSLGEYGGEEIASDNGDFFCLDAVVCNGVCETVFLKELIGHFGFVHGGCAVSPNIIPHDFSSDEELIVFAKSINARVYTVSDGLMKKCMDANIKACMLK